MVVEDTRMAGNGHQRLSNLEIAELMARSADEASDYRKRAYARAARAALAWPVEASDLVAEGRSPSELLGIGDRLARRIESWIDDPPPAERAPEARRGFSTLATARAIVQGHPEWRSRLKADLQMHSTHSDGTASIAAMADGARALGHSYVAITDHSQGLKIAGGMSPKELSAQAREVAELNRSYGSEGFRILHGLEMNIDVAGSGDMEPEVLVDLDIVLGSFHSKLRGTQDSTSRYLAALANPRFHVLGHPRGRMYGTRAGLKADWARVFAAAAEAGKAVEIDCHPNRQDLNVELAARAAAAGCYISIGTDAHSTDELESIELGIATALAAGAPRERILNFMTAQELIAWVRSR